MVIFSLDIYRSRERNRADQAIRKPYELKTLSRAMCQNSTFWHTLQNGLNATNTQNACNFRLFFLCDERKMVERDEYNKTNKMRHSQVKKKVFWAQ